MIVCPLVRLWTAIIADSIVSGSEGPCRSTELHRISLVSTKNNVEFIVIVAAILDYVTITLTHVDGDYHFGFLCQVNVHAGLTIAFLLCNRKMILICIALPSAGGHLEYMIMLNIIRRISDIAQYHQSNCERIGRNEAETVKKHYSYQTSRLVMFNIGGHLD